MVLGTLNYLVSREEAKVNLHKDYKNLSDVAKMDCLIDVIADLEDKKTALHEKMYGDE